MSALALAGAALGGAVAVGWPLGRLWWHTQRESWMWLRCTNMNISFSGLGGGIFLLDGTQPVLAVWPEENIRLTSDDMLKMGAMAYGLAVDQLAHTIDAAGRDIVRPKPGVVHRFKAPEHGE